MFNTLGSLNMGENPVRMSDPLCCEVSEEIGEHIFFGNAPLPKMISPSPFVSLPHI